MSRTRALKLAVSSVVFAGALVHGQTPITSLPRPPGEANTTDAGATDVTRPAVQYQPSGDSSTVHPITSLPKPPSATQPDPPAAVPEYKVPEYTVPSPVVDTTPAVSSSAPAATTPATPPANAAVYVLPSTASSKASVAALPAPPPTLDAPLRASTSQEPVVVKKEPPKVRPFSTFAIQFKVGTNGIGFDAAVPLAQHFDFRGGGSIYSYSGSYDDSGDDITGAAQFRSGEFYVDYYPFSRGPLRLSAGLVINGSYLNATTLVKGGNQFELNNVPYSSSVTDPVNGTASFSFGQKAAPSFTIGLGSMIPRTGKHVSFPFEVGFMYVGDPAINLSLMGTICDPDGPTNCRKFASDANAQANLRQEVNSINADIHFLRFFPILSQGIAFKF